MWTPSREFDIPVISEAITAFSPVDIHVYDQNDNHVGIDSKGDVELEIPKSWYSRKESSPETIILSEGNLDRRVEVVGTETGSYKLNFMIPMNVTDRAGEVSFIITSFTLSNLKINEGQKQLI